MRLSSLIASNDDLQIHGPDVEITSLTADSRQVTQGSLFVAIPGTQNDGRRFINDAYARGAVAVLAPNDSKDLASKSWISTNDIREAVAWTASKFYSQQPTIVAAVTGTSGKTSTAQFAREIWQSLGLNSASIGTLGYVSARETQYGSLTTPDAISLHRLLDYSVKMGITHMALEASSHGLALKRLRYVNLKAAAFTNLSRDHLDFHQTMENYRNAKLLLFTDVLKKGAAAILNADSPEFEVFKQASIARGLKIITFGKKAADLQLIDTVATSQGQNLRLNLFGKVVEHFVPVVGSFQAWNILAALGLVVGSGDDAEAAARALPALRGVPGRMQFIGQKRTGGTVFVDYAHKPDALENVLTAMRPHVAAHNGAKLGVVFGCGGNRDRGKRPLMGSLAQRLADWAIVTDDNPRHENPATIREEILRGCQPSATLMEEGDRAEAIRKGIGLLGPHDVLIVAGKGHESGQILGDEVLPFDDALVAKKVLES